MAGLVKLFTVMMVSAFFCKASSGQKHVELKGKITDSAGNPLSGTIVTAKRSTPVKNEFFAFSNSDGIFSLNLPVDSSCSWSIKVSAMGFKADSTTIELRTGQIPRELGFVLLSKPQTLKEIVIKAQSIPFSIRNDTIEFNAKAYRNMETKKLQDLLANIQGFKVDADGKITFNGKEVEKILVEGEDISEKNYKLISRNLNASFINKVQVLNNFNDDRLMKQVEHTDNIGINLTIDEKFKNKLSGSLELAAGSGSGKSIDNNLILINRKVKLLSFAGYNNVGDLPNADLKYYYNKDNPGGVSSLESFNSENLIKTGLIFPPELPWKYIRNNNDLSAAIISSWKLGSAAKMRMVAAYNKSELKYRNDIFQMYRLPDLEQWQLFEKQASSTELNEFISALALSHDKGKRNAGMLTFELLLPRSNNNYQSKISGAFSDSLVETLNTDKQIFRLEGFESFQVSSKKILKIRYKLNNENSVQGFGSATTRFTRYFLTDSLYQGFNESLKKKLLSADVTAGLFGKRRRMEFSIQSKTTYQRIEYIGDLFADTTRIRKEKKLADLQSGFSLIDQSLIATAAYHASKKISFTNQFRAGLQYTEVNKKGIHLNSVDPVFRTFSRFVYQVKPLAQLSAEYQFSYGKSPEAYFYPDSIISGNVTVLNPAVLIQQPVKHNIGLKYFSNNLRKSTELFLQATISFSAKDFGFAQTIQPEYTVLKYQSFNGNRFVHLIGGYDKLFYPIRLKTGLQVSTMFMRTNLLVNEIRSVNQNNNIRFEGRLSSALKGPFNMELKPVVIYSRNRTREMGGNWATMRFWQFQGSGKMMFRPNDHWYFAAVYLCSVFAKRSFFNSADLFSQFELNNTWSFSFTLHNIFNAGSFVTRDYSPTSYGDQRFSLEGRYFLLKVNWNF